MQWEVALAFFGFVFLFVVVGELGVDFLFWVAGGWVVWVGVVVCEVVGALSGCAGVWVAEDLGESGIGGFGFVGGCWGGVCGWLAVCCMSGWHLGHTHWAGGLVLYGTPEHLVVAWFHNLH